MNMEIILGNLGADPEVRYTKDGKPVANFSVAVTSRWGDNEETEWFRCVAWNKLAEIAGKYCFKGKQVHIIGRRRTREWEDKEGNRRWTVETIVRELKLLGPRISEDDDKAGARYDNRSSAGNNSGYGSETETGKQYAQEDDIPF